MPPGDPPPYRPRLSCELTQDSYNKLQSILPHGFQKPLFQCLTDGIIELYEKGGLEGISAIVARYVSASRVCELGVERAGRVDPDEVNRG